MKKIISIMFAVIGFSCNAHLFAQVNPRPCSNDFFNLDSTRYFFINEIKPFGPDRFVELWNCRDSDFHADMWYVRGMYSNVMDSFPDQSILSEGCLVFPVPSGLRDIDAVQIITRRETVFDTMYTVMYTLHDTVRSIGMCDWYHPMIPTPGAVNNCETVGINKVMYDDEIRETKFYDILGREMINEPTFGFFIVVKHYVSGIKITSRYWR